MRLLEEFTQKLKMLEDQLNKNNKDYFIFIEGLGCDYRLRIKVYQYKNKNEFKEVYNEKHIISDKNVEYIIKAKNLIEAKKIKNEIENLIKEVLK